MEPVLSRRQIAERIGVSVETVDRVRKRDHTFPSPVRLSRTLRWQPDEIHAWMKAQTEHRTAAFEAK